MANITYVKQKKIKCYFVLCNNFEVGNYYVRKGNPF